GLRELEERKKGGSRRERVPHRRRELARQVQEGEAAGEAGEHLQKDGWIHDTVMGARHFRTDPIWRAFYRLLARSHARRRPRTERYPRKWIGCDVARSARGAPGRGAARRS